MEENYCRMLEEYFNGVTCNNLYVVIRVEISVKNEVISLSDNDKR